MFTALYLFMLFSSIDKIRAIHCGFPGRPAYGRALQVADSYSEGQAVTYTCDNGYYMVGPVIRRCLPNGTWTGNMPVCDTTLSPVGYTSSSEALSLYPPELAVDGNKRSCFYSNRRKPRWWRMDMGFSQTVISVSITVPFASSEHHFTIYVIEVNGTLTKYHKCTSFRGIFSSQAMILVCGNGKGITGSVLHIEDDSPHLDHFGLCEIEVFVYKDYYECGLPEVPTNSYTMDKPGHSVKYACVNGYKLEGSHYRTCMRNGQWSGSQPICREVTCPKPQSIENGYYRIYGHTSGKPTLGSKVVFGCKPGFNIVGINDTRFCDENGSWTGEQPECHPIDCGHPSIDSKEHLGGRLKLINSSTKFLSIAELVCFNGKKPGIIIHCREDGTWSRLEATCLYNKANYLYNGNVSDFESQDNSDINIATVLATVIVVALLALILLILFLFKKKILQFKWSTEPINNSLGHRSSWALEALRSTSIQLRKPFQFSPKAASAISTVRVTPVNSSVKPVPSKMDNIYEEISIFSNATLSGETEDKIRKAAMIAAELAAINQQKQNQVHLSNPLTKAETQSPIGLYAKVDLIQKHRDRLMRERAKQNQEHDINSQGLRKSMSSPDPIYSPTTNYESIRVSSLDLSQPYLLKDNTIFVGHPGVSSCDTFRNSSTQNNDNSDDQQVHCVR